MANTEIVDGGDGTTARRVTELALTERTAPLTRMFDAWPITVQLTQSMVCSLLRVMASTAGTALGFSLLVVGVGRPVLRGVERMGEPGEESTLDDTADGAGALRGALAVTGHSWRELAGAAVLFCLAAVAWAVPLALMSIPALLAAGIEPTAAVASRGWEVSISSWGAAIGCAVGGAALLTAVPAALRRLTWPTGSGAMSEVGS